MCVPTQPRLCSGQRTCGPRNQPASQPWAHCFEREIGYSSTDASLGPAVCPEGCGHTHSEGLCQAGPPWGAGRCPKSASSPCLCMSPPWPGLPFPQLVVAGQRVGSWKKDTDQVMTAVLLLQEPPQRWLSPHETAWISQMFLRQGLLTLHEQVSLEEEPTAGFPE